MDRIDRLLKRAKPPVGPCEYLSVNNPYMEMSGEELLDMLCPDTPGGYQAPDMRTREWEKFMYALTSSK